VKFAGLFEASLKSGSESTRQLRDDFLGGGTYMVVRRTDSRVGVIGECCVLWWRWARTGC